MNKKVQLRLVFDEQEGFVVVVSNDLKSEKEYFKSLESAYDWIRGTTSVMRSANIECELTIQDNLKSLYTALS